MHTQLEIAEHLGLSDRKVRDILKNLGMDHRDCSMDEIRLAYIADLREKAAGRQANGDMDLATQRALNAYMDSELKALQIAEKKGLLVNREQLQPELEMAFMHFKSVLMSASNEIRQEIEAIYGIEFDERIVRTIHRNALSELAKHAGGHSVTDS